MSRNSAFALIRFLFCVGVIATGSASAQPAPTLTDATPIYLKQAETQDVTLNGAKLSGATGVVLTDARGLTAELVVDEKADPKNAGKVVALKLSAASDATLGTRELRIVTPLGVTPPLAVTVGQFGAVRDVEPNNTPDQAVTASLPASIIGRVDVGGDVDDYRFNARRGQTLVFDVYAGRLGSPLEPVVSIHDANGHEQPRAISHRAGDPTLVFTVPADGVYVLSVRDIQFRGGDYVYRIDAGEIPFVESIVPSAGRRGEKVEVRAIGHNLGATSTTTIDLTGAEPGPMEVRFKTAAGFSNAVPFNVAAVSQVAEQPAEANRPSTRPTAVSLPADVAGVLAKPGEEDVYRFSVPTKQLISIEAFARRNGSPVDALLTLRDSGGKTVEQNNGAGDTEARINRSLEPGDYAVAIRDLSFGGGPSHGYRLAIRPAADVPADFTVRFIPDAPRVARGSHTRVWCEVTRLNGYKGDIAVSVDGLPQGVSVTGGVATISEQSSGIFTISAADDAALGVTPIRLRAVGSFGAQQTIRLGDAELAGRNVRGSYLTVLDKPPFTVESVSAIGPKQIAAYPAEAQRLFTKLNAPSPELDKAQAEWEKKFENAQQWQAVDVTSTESASGSVLKKLPDGSLLQTEKFPEKETYIVVGTASLKEVTAVRLEVLPDPSLPNSGPGRSDSGNFVLHSFAVSVAPKSDPKNTKPVALTAAKATFEQPGYGVLGAANNNLQDGWAISGGTGKPQTAWFFPETPVPAGDVIVTVSMIQYYGQQHTIGRFRIALSDDPTVKDRQTDSAPAAVASALKVQPDKRSADQKAQLSSYYRSIAPELRADRARLEALRRTVGPLAEVDRLEKTMEQGSPALDAERKEWEQKVLAGVAWAPVDIIDAKAANGAVLAKEADGSVMAGGPAAPAETYTVGGKSALRQVWAVKLEVLPDDRLPMSGPGRAGGNFVLSRFSISAAGAKPGETVPVPISSAAASFEQNNYTIAGSLDDRPETGWAIAPLFAHAHSATFNLRSPLLGPDGTTPINVAMEFSHPKFTGFNIGRFRLWALGSLGDSADAVPSNILTIIRVPEEKRTDVQKAEIGEYHRSVSWILEPTRQRLAELKRSLPQSPIVVARNKSVAIPVPVMRDAAFTGPVQVTIEGFSAGRDPQSRMPTAMTKNFDVTPLNITPDAAVATLNVKAKANSELGTRNVVLRAEAKVGNDTYVMYSPAFPITVTEK